MNFKKREMPIGFFDSGIGGLNLLSQSLKVLKHENFVYFGDNINAPYGNKSLFDLKKCAMRGINELLEYGVKIIVVACNTLSTKLCDYIKTVSPVPTVFTMPSFDYDKSKYFHPAIIATPITSSSDYVTKNFKGFSIVPLPFLAGEIENNVLTPQKISVEKDLRALNDDVDYLVLGCTHYVFVKDRIKQNLTATVSDNLSEIALELKSQLEKRNLEIISRKKPTILFVGPSKEYNQTVFQAQFKSQKTHKVVTRSQI